MADNAEPTTADDAEVEAHSEPTAPKTEVFDSASELVCGIYDPKPN
ncbi:hypothetical protein [Streptomyces sp. NPDC006739]